MPKISRISTTNIVLMIDQFNDKDEDKRILDLRETNKKKSEREWDVPFW